MFLKATVFFTFLFSSLNFAQADVDLPPKPTEPVPAAEINKNSQLWGAGPAICDVWYSESELAGVINKKVELSYNDFLIVKSSGEMHVADLYDDSVSLGDDTFAAVRVWRKDSHAYGADNELILFYNISLIISNDLDEIQLLSESVANNMSQAADPLFVARTYTPAGNDEEHLSIRCAPKAAGSNILN